MAGQQEGFELVAQLRLNGCIQLAARGLHMSTRHSTAAAAAAAAPMSVLLVCKTQSQEAACGCS
jgi:hypothetical protein